MKRTIGEGRERFTLTEAEFEEEVRRDRGMCRTCEQIAEGIRPNAMQERCEFCGKRTVYSVGNLMLLGFFGFEDAGT